MPTEDYVATVRALGIRPQKPTNDDSFANAMVWQVGEAGQPPYEWPAPDGYPRSEETERGRAQVGSSPASRSIATWPPGGGPPTRRRFPSYASMLPPMPATLVQIIDHQALRMFGQRPSDSVRQGVAQLLGMSLTRRLTKDEALDYWVVRGMLSSLLDSPLHLHR